MGCFDSVCSISNTPICCGDDTVELFVGAQVLPIYGAITYEAIMLPLFGEYNDYGELENVDKTSLGWRTAQWMVTNEFKDVIRPTHRAKDPWEIFKDNIHVSPDQCLPNHWGIGAAKCEFELEEPPSYDPDQIAYKKISSNNTTTSKVFVHRRVYDHIINVYLDQEIGYGEAAKTPREYFEDIPEFIQEVAKRERVAIKYNAMEDGEERDLFLLENGTTEFGLLYNLDGAMTLDSKKFYDNHYHPLSWSLKGDRDGRAFHHFALMKMRERIQQLCSEERLDEAEELLRAILEVFSFMQGLRMHNKDLTPYGGFSWEQGQSGEGAQQMINMFNVFIGIQEERIQKWKEWDEE